MALSDLMRPRIAELGKIKIGGKSAEVRRTKNGGTWRAPEKFDHFQITTLRRDGNGDLESDAALMSSLAEFADPDGKLRSLPIAVLSNDIEDILQSSYVWYQGARVAGRSDGLTLTVYFDRLHNCWHKEPKTLPWEARYAGLVDDKGNRLFKLHTIFSCVLASAQSRWGGVYKFRTTSAITGEQLYGSLTHLKQLLGGMLRGMPLRLVMRPLQVTPNGQPSTIYVVHVELLGSNLADIQKLAVERAKLELTQVKEMEAARLEYKRLLSSPGEHESLAEQAEIAGEFHPEEVERDDQAAAAGLIAPAVNTVIESEQKAVPA